MNQKIGTGIGTIIIIIIAIIVGAFIWKYEKGQPTNEMQTSQTLPISEKNQPERPQIVGGPCEYEKVPGTCAILSLSEDGTAKFNFVATGTLPDNPLAENLNGEHSDSLNILNTQNLSIKAGDKINCEASIETRGTCTPVIFRFTK